MWGGLRHEERRKKRRRRKKEEEEVGSKTETGLGGSVKTYSNDCVIFFFFFLPSRWAFKLTLGRKSCCGRRPVERHAQMIRMQSAVVYGVADLGSQAEQPPKYHKYSSIFLYHAYFTLCSG